MFIPDPGSRIRIFSIPFPRSWIKIFFILDPWSRIWIFPIPDPGSRMRIKEFKYFNQKKWFLSSQKYDPSFTSRIRIPNLDPDFLPIPDPNPGSQIPNPGIKKAPDPWFRIPDPDSQHWRFWVCSGCSGLRWLLTFNGRCCLKNSFNGSALRSFYVWKKILRISYFHIISLIFTVFKLWCPAHLFPNTPRTRALEKDMSRPGLETRPPRRKASTLAKSYCNSQRFCYSEPLQYWLYVCVKAAGRWILTLGCFQSVRTSAERSWISFTSVSSSDRVKTEIQGYIAALWFVSFLGNLLFTSRVPFMIV